MNKFPLDRKGIEDIVGDFLNHNEAQSTLIRELSFYLGTALTWLGDPDEFEDSDWLTKAKKLTEDLQIRQRDFDNFRFDQENGHNVAEISPYKAMNPNLESELNKIEEEFGEAMSEEDLAKHFNEPIMKKKKSKSIKSMDLEEIDQWEKEQDNSNDIYKVSARVKNLARAGAGANLTPVGEMLTNTYVHVLKSFYDFAENLEDKEVKIKLVNLIRANEGMPGTFIAATGAGVK